jgi:hypothetical protein
MSHSLFEIATQAWFHSSRFSLLIVNGRKPMLRAASNLISHQREQRADEQSRT